MKKLLFILLLVGCKTQATYTVITSDNFDKSKVSEVTRAVIVTELDTIK